MICCIDFETKDTYIQMGMGAGWAYAYNWPETPYFKVLGCSLKIDNEPAYYTTDMYEVLCKVKEADILIAHNATYELGILKYLEKTMNCCALNTSSRKVIYDTKLLYKLLNNVLQSYSLDALAQKYLKYKKGYDVLVDIVWEHDLYPWTKKELQEKVKIEKQGFEYYRPIPEDKAKRAKVLKFAYANFDKLQEVAFDQVSKYANLDAELTKQLYDNAMAQLDKSLVDTFAKLTHICVAYRLKGIRVDLNEVRRLIEVNEEHLTEIYKTLYSYNDNIPFSIRSADQIQPILDKLNISFGHTATGKAQITTSWLDEQEHEFCTLIKDARQCEKLKSDFLQKVLDWQQYINPANIDYGMLYPELNSLEAVTGRFSSSSPNLQQQSKKGNIRNIFIPFDGETMYSLDFSNQEGRLQIHYGIGLQCPGIQDIQQEFNINPAFDLHQMVANMMDTDRKTAKTINLGLSYGMGLDKLAKSLNVSYTVAKDLKEKYLEFLPFMKELMDTTKKALKDKGYIKTILGRISHIDKPMFIDGEMKSFEYKALNKLIQGTACDQTVMAMIMAYEENIPVIFPIHDELLASTADIEQIKRLKWIMENCIKLRIPSLTEVKAGKSWGEMEKITLEKPKENII